MNAVTRNTEHKTVTPIGKRREIKGVVLHHTGTTRAVACSSNGSWHYIVDRDGTIYADIPEVDIAWHTARCDRWNPAWVQDSAPWFSGSDINTCTIGIEIVCHPDIPEASGYEYKQLVALYDLFDHFKETYGELHYVGHGMVQSDRRVREPEGFDWEGFDAEDGAGHGYLFSHNPYKSVKVEEEPEMSIEERQILDACERHEIKSAEEIDQLLGRYDLLAQQVESLEGLLASAQAERDAAVEKCKDCDPAVVGGA